MVRASPRPMSCARALTADASIPTSMGHPATTRRQTKFLREGAYAAEVDIELIDEEGGWSPYLSMDDIRKLDDVRLALRRGDVDAASRLARVFSLTPVGR